MIEVECNAVLKWAYEELSIRKHSQSYYMDKQKHRSASHQTYISPWSCRHLWYRLVAEAVAPLSQGPWLFHWLESHHMVWSQMSSAPRLLHLQRGRQLVCVSLTSCHSLCSLPIWEKKWGWQAVSCSSITQYQNSYVDKLALPAEVGVSRMHFCAWGTEERKMRKGSPSVLPGPADAFAILRRYDQTLGKRFGS